MASQRRKKDAHLERNQANKYTTREETEGDDQPDYAPHWTGDLACASSEPRKGHTLRWAASADLRERVGVRTVYLASNGIV